MKSVKLVIREVAKGVGTEARISRVQSLYQSDLAYVHATAFETLAHGPASEIVRRLQSSSADNLD